MKLLLSFLFSFSFIPVLLAQCPPGDVGLYTQEEVDEFIQNYPQCEIISGNLLIGSTVTDLSGLTGIIHINGDLTLITDVQNLENFSKLRFVGGNLSIKNNNSLKKISGFEMLTEIRGDLDIFDNPGLTTLEGFGSLTRIGGSFKVQANYQILTLNAFSALETVGGNFWFAGTRYLRELRGFNSLISVGERFELHTNDGLQLIDGFHALESVGSVLHIWETSCKILRGFYNLQSVGGDLSLQGFYEEIPLFNSLTYLGGGIEFSGLNTPDISGFNNLTTINGWFLLTHNDGLQKITGFNSLVELKGVLQFILNPALVTFRGLRNLQIIGGLLQINENDSLQSLEGLESLIKVAGPSFINDDSFLITNNDSLTDCSAICDLLASDGITGRTVIVNNPSACSSREEITEGCGNKLTLCKSDGPVDLFSSLSDGEPSGGSWSPATISGSGVFDPAKDSPGTYVYSFSNGDGEASVEVVVNDPPQAGNDNTVKVCTADSYLDLFQLLGGSPEAGGSWTLNNSDVSSPYAISQLGPGQYDFQYTIRGGGCPDASAVVTVVLEKSPATGNNAVISLCEQDAQVDLLDLLGPGVDAGGSWNPVPGSGTGVFDPAVDLPGIYVYTVQSADCGSSSSQVEVSVTEAARAGEDEVVVLCENVSPVDLFTLLSGNPQPGGSWSLGGENFSGVFDPAQHPAGEYIYTVDSFNCGSDDARLEIQVETLPKAGSDANFSTCSNGPTKDLFELLGPGAESGGNWTPVLSGSQGVFNPAVDAAGVYTYTVSTENCGVASAAVSVEINDSPNAGMDAAVTVCAVGNPFDLFEVIEGQPDAGGIWSPILKSGNNLFDPSVDTAGKYIYTVGTEACGTNSSEVEVEITEAPDAGEDAELKVCINEEAFDLFPLLGESAQPGGSWSPGLKSGTGYFDPAVDREGSYTYTTGTAKCGTASASVVISFSPLMPLEIYEIQVRDMGPNSSIEINTPQDREFEYSLDGSAYVSGNTFRNLQGGEYIVFIKEIGGCGYVEEKVWLMTYPGFFSPNNDGVNDFWHFKGTNGKQYTLKIYNRYGKLLATLGAGEKWNGLYEGNPLPADDYWFEVRFEEGLQKRGHFSLLR